MSPYDVKLAYMGKPWCTVPLEVGRNEIGDADAIDWIELADVADLFAKTGLPAPGKAPIMPIKYQIAQKLHAVTSGGDRARDLVDLQLIARNCEVDLVETRSICVRLFSYRKAQAWPPLVESRSGWETLYAEQSAGLPVLSNVDEAVEWANAFIRKIDGVHEGAAE